MIKLTGKLSNIKIDDYKDSIIYSIKIEEEINRKIIEFMKHIRNY